jgi:hypothetical protein
MFIHPCMHLKIARQQQPDLLARSERHRIAKASRAFGQEDRGGWLIGRQALHESSQPTACGARRSSA